jgi:TP901 family phage tail tape measure protein
VEKTVNGTGAQIAGLRQGIVDMAREIPASREEIAEVAVAAGQLGIATDDILGFTQVMIDLGEMTNLTESATRRPPKPASGA